MKKSLALFTILSFAFLRVAFSQAERTISITEKRLADSVCNSVNRLDVSKITTRDAAVAFYTQCIGDHLDLLNDLATERNVDVSDNVAMRKIGIDLAFDLYKMKCANFVKLSSLIAMKTIDKDTLRSDITVGAFKRIDQKGFNYIVIVDNNSEKSFIWLRQFPGSEKFMNGITQYIGKKVRITWQDIEVYLPQSKGYYNVKEIKYLDFF